MKIIVTTIKIALLTFFTFNFINAQHVGVATTTPDAPFHVGSSGQVLTSGGLVLLGKRNENYLELDFNRVQSFFGIEHIPTTFFLQPNGGNTDIGGKMAIGTNDFTTMLNIDGGLPVSESGKGTMIIGDVDNYHVRFDENDILARDENGPALLRLQSYSGNLSLVDDNDGKLGIGTLFPQAKVQITDGPDVDLSDGGHLILGETTGYNLAFDNNEIMARNNGAMSSMYLQGNGGDVLMIPNEAGTVGIGVTSSAYLPDGFLLAVDGKIISEEIRVELSGDWPDYVFESDYELTALNELELKINELGHLPGIPSAEKVEEEGLDLGDMNKRMMEKIEELTLYMIEADKKIRLLERKLNEIEDRQ
ncbi:MAG: hypothetical protein P1U56_11195 [Saprospiraceae bacterium]|nr:hypothetical protein [Saprospiraceae bacterium]